MRIRFPFLAFCLILRSRVGNCRPSFPTLPLPFFFLPSSSFCMLTLLDFPSSLHFPSPPFQYFFSLFFIFIIYLFFLLPFSSPFPSSLSLLSQFAMFDFPSSLRFSSSPFHHIFTFLSLRSLFFSPPCFPSLSMPRFPFSKLALFDSLFFPLFPLLFIFFHLPLNTLLFSFFLSLSFFLFYFPPRLFSFLLFPFT